MVNTQKKVKYAEGQKIFFLLIGFLVIMLSVTGATYAYFTLTASNNAVTGTTGGVSLNLTVTKVSGDSTIASNMLPQSEDALGLAISSEYNCLDSRGYLICEVYKATVKNTSDSVVNLLGTISFEYKTDTSLLVENQMPNLKWRRLDNATTLGEYTSYSATSNEDTFEESKKLSPDDSFDYYFVVWINAINQAQTDTGEFRVNINFRASMDDGLTSTIRPKYLSTAEVGSYVAYTGNNGCPEGHCDGTNANTKTNVANDMGYCSSSSYKFTAEGWRIMSTDENAIYLISAGAPECMGTNGNEEICETGTSCSGYVSDSNLYIHYENMNEIARTYCNISYAKGGVCDETTAWAMKDSDYQKITGNTLSACFYDSSEECGLNNDLIDNGGYYWYASPYSGDIYTGDATFYWDAKDYYLVTYYSYKNIGVRPVLKLDTTIIITGGSGTMTDPYQIAN